MIPWLHCSGNEAMEKVHPDFTNQNFGKCHFLRISFSRCFFAPKAVIIPEWLTTLGGNSFSYAGSLVIHNWKGTVKGTWGLWTFCDIYWKRSYTDGKIGKKTSSKADDSQKSGPLTADILWLIKSGWIMNDKWQATDWEICVRIAFVQGFGGRP